MAVFNYKGVGLRNVGSYQISGDPYITGSGDQADESMKRFQFPSVTREVTVFNLSFLGNGTTACFPIHVHFASGSTALTDFATKDLATSVNTNAKWIHGEINHAYHSVPLHAGESITFTAKMKEIYVTCVSGSANYRIIADLTGIPTGSMYQLTGSGITDRRYP